MGLGHVGPYIPSGDSYLSLHSLFNPKDPGMKEDMVPIPVPRGTEKTLLPTLPSPKDLRKKDQDDWLFGQSNFQCEDLGKGTADRSVQTWPRVSML